MPRFALHRLPDGQPEYVVDVQADLLHGLDSRVVIPLRPAHTLRAVEGLHPVVRIDGRPYLIATHQLSAVPRSLLGRPVGTLAEQQDEIGLALDRLLVGF